MSLENYPLKKSLEQKIDETSSNKLLCNTLINEALDLSLDYMKTHLPQKYKKEAEDLAQEVAIAFFIKYESGDFIYESKVKFRSWILKSSKNKTIDFYKSQKDEFFDSITLFDNLQLERSYSPKEHSYFPKENVLSPYHQKVWNDFYNGLEVKQKLIINMRLYYEGISNTTIAETTELNRSKINSSSLYLKKRARNFRLKDKLLE
jgi:RNA polymerase sigma factor (sigma-70 family)